MMTYSLLRAREAGTTGGNAPVQASVWVTHGLPFTPDLSARRHLTIQSSSF